MKIIRGVLGKLFGLLFIGISCILMLAVTYPFSISIVNTLIGNHPIVCSIVQYSWVFLGMVYGIYLKKIRNDDRRRAYLIETRRIYPGFVKDIFNIAKSRDFLHFSIAAVLLLVFLLFFWLNPALFPAPRFWSRTAALLLGVVGLDIAYLLMENATHTYWIGILQVPEESEVAASWRRFNRYHMRLYIKQFFFVVLYVVFYCINPYLVSLPVCFTPFLFILYQLYGYHAIKERKDRNKPYKKYLWLQVLSAVAYSLAFLFGVFAPRA